MPPSEKPPTTVARPRHALLERLAAGPRAFEPPADRYVPESELGRGGMAEVLGRRDLHLGRVVAMKVLRAADPSTIARFHREARVQARLEHPSIVPVYDIGLDGDTPYITMKRIDGVTLAEILADAEQADRHPLRRLLAAFGAVCLAIDYAHARGVIHRDLKPSNVMLGGFGEVYVLDWGVAKTSDDAEDDRGVVVGTPGYMAPEQLRGETADARSDVYALGAILFELLTRSPLHAGEQRAEPTRETIARASKSSQIAPELFAVCERATAESPDDRFANAAEIYHAIDRHLAGEQDVERRRARSIEHARAAVAATSGPTNLEGRATAMRELSRALALDPENRDAMRTLVRLIQQPPDDVPAEVDARLEARVLASLVDLAPSSAVAYLAFFGLAPLVLLMGVRDWAAGIVCGALVLATAATVVVTRRARHFGRASLYPALAMSNVVIASAVTMFGPFVFVPTLAALNTLFFVAQLGRERMVSTIAVGTLPVVVPAALQWLGVLPPSYELTGDRMLVLPWMHHLPRGSTEVFLLSSSVVAIAASSMFASRVRESLTRAERRLELYAWQLGKLLPEDPPI